jgi:hypothetical protein
LLSELDLVAEPYRGVPAVEDVKENEVVFHGLKNENDKKIKNENEKKNERNEESEKKDRKRNNEGEDRDSKKKRGDDDRYKDSKDSKNRENDHGDRDRGGSSSSWLLTGIRVRIISKKVDGNSKVSSYLLKGSIVDVPGRGLATIRFDDGTYVCTYIYICLYIYIYICICIYI